MTRPPLSLSFLLIAGAACHHTPPVPKVLPGSLGQPIDPKDAPPPLSGHNLLYNETFDHGTRILPWTGDFSKPAEGRAFVDKGELCLEIKDRGANRWDAA